MELPIEDACRIGWAIDNIKMAINQLNKTQTVLCIDETKALVDIINRLDSIT